jgi:hypothetical protein
MTIFKTEPTTARGLFRAVADVSFHRGWEIGRSDVWVQSMTPKTDLRWGCWQRSWDYFLARGNPTFSSPSWNTHQKKAIVLYVKESNSSPGFWGLTRNQLHQLDKPHVRWFAVLLLKSNNNGYVLTSNEVINRVKDGTFELSKDGDHKINERTDLNPNMAFRGIKDLLARVLWRKPFQQMAWRRLTVGKVTGQILNLNYCRSAPCSQFELRKRVDRQQCRTLEIAAKTCSRIKYNIALMTYVFNNTSLQLCRLKH